MTVERSEPFILSMKVVGIALVLLQATLHSCRTYNTASKNDTETAKPVKLPAKVIQILESFDTPDAKITKIKELIPVYNDFPELRVKSNKKHVYMPYKKKGKPLAYILKKAYVNEIVSEHTDENFDSFENVKSNERMYKRKPPSYRNKVYYTASQNEKKREKHRMYEYPKIPEIKLIDEGEVKNEPENNNNDQYNKNAEIKKSEEVTEDLKESTIVLPAEHKYVHHTHRHNIGNPEEKAEVASNPMKSSAVLTDTKHKESIHVNSGVSDSNLDQIVQYQKVTEDKLIGTIPKAKTFQSEVNSDFSDSNRKQILQHQKVTDDKPIDTVLKAKKIQKKLDHIETIHVHKHRNHHHPEPDISKAVVANTDGNYTLDIVTTKHHKPNLDEENVNSKNDLINHIVHNTEYPHDLAEIDANDLHSDEINPDSDSKQKYDKSKLVIGTNGTEQKFRKREHSHSHSNHKSSVKDLDKYLSYLNQLVSPKTYKENDLSNGTLIGATLNDTSLVSKDNNDKNVADFNIIQPSRTQLTNNQVALSELNSTTTHFSASEYHSDDFGFGNTGDASGSSEPSSEFKDSVLDSNQESTETDENSSTTSSESENTSLYSNEMVTNDSKSSSAFKSLQFDSVLSSSQSESSAESNESGISGLEEIPSEDSNLISESVELSSESDSTNLSDESNSSKLKDNFSPSFESQSSELRKPSEVGLNSISESDNSDSASEDDSKSDFSSSSESKESSEVDSAGANILLTKESITEPIERQLNSTVNIPTILGKTKSISKSVSGLNSKEYYTESTPTHLKLASEKSYSRLDANATSSEIAAFMLESSREPNIESNASSTVMSTLLETTTSSSIATEGSTSSYLVNRLNPNPSNPVAVFRIQSYPSNLESKTYTIENSSLLETTALNSSSTAKEVASDSNIVNASIFKTPFSVESIVSSLMLSANSLKSVASNLESSALSLESVSGLESITSKLNTTASELMYVASNLETTALSLKRGSRFSKQTNNNGLRTVKKGLCKDRVVEKILNNGEKTYSISFVFNK